MRGSSKQGRVAAQCPVLLVPSIQGSADEFGAYGMFIAAL